MATNTVAPTVGRKIISGMIAGINTDPNFYSKLSVLPNPDPILRRMGMADDTYNAIMADPHVIGEVRTMRAELIGYKFRLKAGGDDPKAQQAYELTKDWYNNTRPSDFLTWDDIRWNMFTAVLYGFKAHELDWQSVNGYWLPVQVVDRPNRRFVYSTDKQLRLLTKEQPNNGIEVEPWRFVVTRHMPTHEDPYGCALLSSCFWPYTFKNGGWKFFYNFCEKFGMPWPIGRYPQGAKPAEQNELLDALIGLAQAGAAAIPEGSSVELLTANQSGELAQEALIHLCNREISKALTSQTLATEMHDVGSNAAAQTHSERQGGNSLADRNMVLASFNEILRWITEFNFGADVAPPTCEFYQPKRATKERMEAIDIGVKMGANPSRKAVLEELQLPEAENDEDRLQVSQSVMPGLAFTQHNCPSCKSYQFQANESSAVKVAARAADKVLANDFIQPVYDMLHSYEEQGKTLAEFLEDLPKMFSQIDDTALADINTQVLMYAMSQGIEHSQFVDDKT